MKNLTLVSYFGLTFAVSLGAQEVKRFTFDGGVGFTQPVGNTGRQLNEGWNIQGGAGINFSSYLGAKLQLDYNSFGINSFTLNNAGFGAGSIHVFSATIDPIVHLRPHSRLDPYLIGGSGLYHFSQEFTQPIVALTGGDTTVPATGVLSSYSVNKPGVNGGAGIAFGTKWNGKLFAEARYQRIFLGNDRHMDYVPVSFGFRW